MQRNLGNRTFMLLEESNVEGDDSGDDNDNSEIQQQSLQVHYWEIRQLFA